MPGTIENVLANGGPQKYYRNHCLCQGMVSFNMIDTIGHGIEKVFSEQRRRRCHLPEYMIDNVVKDVRVKVFARNYTNADNSFMTSGMEENVIKEPFMTSEKGGNVYIPVDMGSLIPAIRVHFNRLQS